MSASEHAETATGGAARYDAIVVGAGPVGLASALECQRRGARVLAIDKGCVTANVHRFPLGMRFFSTAPLIEIGGHPLAATEPKPTREQALEYYRRVRHAERLEVLTYQRVERLVPGDHGFTVISSGRAGSLRHEARAVVVATGYYDHPNRIGVPGEDLPHVSHYYVEAHPHDGDRVVVVGGSSSASEVALDLCRHGARVTLVHRGRALRESVKYWLRPDLENRITEGAIAAHFETTVERIGPISVALAGPSGRLELKADAVYLLTGYHPDTGLLSAAGVDVNAETLVPRFDPESLETNVPGLYVAGSAAGGRAAGRIFIENGREHARLLAGHLAARLGSARA